MDELIAFFELADFRCQPCPEHIGRKRKMKSSDAAMALAAKKTFGKRGRGKRSTHAKTRTSTQELMLAKPLGRSKKFSAKSSGLSVAEKASLLGVGAASGKSKRALKLFGSDSSVSDDEHAPSRLPQKHPWESFTPKQVAEPAR
jgi:hypothetical protein